MKKILVPVDFSEVSIHATRFAVELADRFGAEITLLNSIHFDLYSEQQLANFSGVRTIVKDVRAAVFEKMEEFAKQFDTKHVIHTEVNGLNLVSAVKDMVEEQKFDLVVIGTTGSSGLSEMMVGSNAERIVRHASCPVISIPGSVQLESIKKILVPLDLRELRSGFLAQISMLQSNLKCKLEFAWVTDVSFSERNEERLGRELARIFKEHKIDNYRIFIVNNISPEEGIFLEAKDTNADMVAMATHARRGISHWLSGSLTEDTVNHLDIPVWSFKIDKSEKIINLIV
ncbi:universal stress protein [Ekhidna sp.]|uniref:universal stress protein n=1 Tax=Ekhidna sp. TaxID=2608089 RepID=UPI003CCB8529